MPIALMLTASKKSLLIWKNPAGKGIAEKTFEGEIFIRTIPTTLQ